MMKRSWVRNLFARPATRPIRKMRRTRLALEQLEERLTPSASFSITPFNPTNLVQPAGGKSGPFADPYHGGPLLTHVQVQGVYYNDPTTLGLQRQFDGFFRDILQSPWLTQMLANYSVPNYTIGAGSFLGDDNTGLTVPEGSILDIGMIFNQLTSEVANHKLAAPNDNTLYSVFVPAGVEVPGVAVRSGDAIAYHVSVFDRLTLKAVFSPFLVIPYQGAAPDGRTGPDGPNNSFNDGISHLARGPALSEFQELTIALSHELSETIADPNAGTGWGEIGDLAQGYWVTYHGYAMQEEWGRNPADPPGLAFGLAVAPADTDFAVTHLNPTWAFNGVIATFADKDGASESPSQFKVGVAWADGTFSRTDDGSGDVTVASNDDGTFNVLGRHTTAYGSVFVSSGDEIALNFSPDTLQRVTFTVTSVLDDSSVGTLRWAVGQANSTAAGLATINFAPAVFNTPQTIQLTGAPLELSNTSAIEYIAGPAAGVTVSGGGLSRVFQVDAGGTASLLRLTITEGKTAGSGGGLDNEGGVTTLTNCTVSGNAAANNGGGLYNNYGVITLTNCTVSGNSTSGSGGGLYNYGTATLTNCSVSGNRAGRFGGGLLNSSGTATLTNCTVSGNAASRSGGGLYDRASTTLTNCTVSGNTAGLRGGGLSDTGGTTALTNCTLSGNFATTNGGGINSNNNAGRGTTTLTNCTVSGNSTAGSGGGLSVLANTITISNSIVAGNTATGSGPDAFQTLVSLGNNLIGKTDGSTGWVSSDLTGTTAMPLNPLLAPLGNYSGPTQTMALLPGSPAINAGTALVAPATDQRGIARVGALDIGAFESRGFSMTITGGNNQQAIVNTPFATPLSVQVSSANHEPVQGGVVAFSAPGSGASAVFPGGATATLDASGMASVSAGANGIAGSYAVGAAASGATSQSFSLANLTPGVQPGQTASLFFWAGTRGQALINRFNGGSAATGLANWLALTFPNLFGAHAGSHNLFGMSNSQVAAFYETRFLLNPFDGQVLATALNVYASTQSLGGTAALAYGFSITTTGLGASSISVGSNGAAFGVANNTTLTVNQLLQAVNRQAVNGILYSGDLTLSIQALLVFYALNNTAGGVG